MKTTFLSLLFILLGLGILGAMVRRAPEPTKAPAQIPLQRVETVEATVSDETIRIEAHGVVKPARQVSLRSRVSGEVISQDPRLVQGGRFAEGEILLQIDTTDYELAVLNQQEAVANARYQLEVEQGRRSVAADEWELFGDSIPTTEEGRRLALREPHLNKARATLEAAKGRLKKAELDVARTQIKAPFDAVVLRENVEQGQLVATNGELANLVDVSTFWVQVSLPYAEIKHLRFADGDDGGSTAEVKTASGETYQGRVLHLLTDLEEAGRMARIILQVDQPLDQPDKQALLLGSYVKVSIKGEYLDQVVEVPYLALRESDETAAGSSDEAGTLWLLDASDNLLIRQVALAWKTDQHIYVKSGLAGGERIITSDIPVALAGMKLKEVDPKTEPTTLSRAPRSQDSVRN